MEIIEKSLELILGREFIKQSRGEESISRRRSELNYGQNSRVF